MGQYEVEILAKLDTSEAEAKMNALKSSLKSIGNDNKIKLTLEASGVTSQLNAIKQQLQGLNNTKISLNGGKNISGISNTSKELSKTFSELMSMSKQISSMESKIVNLKLSGNHTNQITELENQLKSIKTTYDSLSKSFDEKGGFLSGQFDVGDMQKLQNNIAIAENKIAEAYAKNKDANIAKASKIIGEFDGNVGKNIEKVVESYGKLGTKTKEVEEGTFNFLSAQNNMQLAKQSGDVDKIIDSYDKYKIALEEVKNINKEAFDTEQFQLAKDNLFAEMDDLLNSANATEEFKNKVRELKTELQTVDDNSGLTKIRKDFDDLNASQDTNTWRSFGDGLGNIFDRYLSTTALVTRGISVLKDMYNEVHAVDTAMTELYRVTDLSKSQYNSLYDDMVSSANEYGASLDGIITSTASWVRLGFNAKDANELAGITSMYQHVTDLDESTAVNNLVTAYKGYEKQLLESTGGDKTKAVEKIADIYDALGNQFAESASDVGEGMSKTASVMSLGGASFEEAVGMFTGIQEVLQNPSTAGNTLKILTLRLRGMKGELQELGEDVDENVLNLSKMQGQVLNLTNGKVNIFDNQGNFRNVYDVMADIAGVYDELSDPDKANLLEVIAGKNRANGVTALLDNWSQVEKATEAAYNSEGTARQEQEVWAQSLDGYLQKLDTSWQTFSNDFLNSDFLKSSISGLTGITDALDGMVETFGGFSVVGAGNILFQLLRNKGSGLKSLAQYFKSFGDLGEFINEFGVGDTAKLFGGDLLKFLISPSGILTAIGLVTSAIGVATNAYEKHRQKISELRQEDINEAKESAETISNVMLAYGDYKQVEQSRSNSSASKEEFVSSSTAVLSALGKEESEINKLTRSYDKLGDSVDNAVGDALQDNVNKAIDGFNSASDNFNDAIGKGDFVNGIKHGLGLDDLGQSLSWVEMDKNVGLKIQKILNRKGFNTNDNIDVYGGNIKLKTGDIEEAKETYKKLVALDEEMQQEVKNGNLSQEEYNKSAFVNDLKSNISEYEKILGEYLDSEKILNEALADQQLFENVNKNGLPKSVDEIASLKNELLETAIASNQFSGSMEDIEEAVDNSLEAMAEGSPVLKQFLKDFQEQEEYNKLSASEKEQRKLDNRVAFQNGIKDFDDYKEIDAWANGLTDEEKEIVYTLNVRSDASDLRGFQEDLENVQKYGKTSAEQMKMFSDVVNSEDFSEQVDTYTESLSSLQDILTKIETGTLTDSDKLNIAKSFPKLEPYINDTKDLKNATKDLINTYNEDINSSIDEQIESLKENYPEAVSLLELFRSSINNLGYEASRNFDFDNASTNFSNLYSALKESVSATGLTAQSKKNIDAMYSGIEGYDQSALFERTASGIHLNTVELSKLNSEYRNQQKQNIQKDLDGLIDNYKDLSREIANCTDANEKANKLAKLDNLKSQITDLADQASMYDALTSPYNTWLQAQSAGEEGDMYDNIRSGIESAQKLYDEGLVGTNELRAFTDMMSSKNLATASADEVRTEYERLGQTINGTSYSALDFFQEGKEGCEAFLNSVQDLNSDWAHFNEETDKWESNFGKGNDKEIADALGISEDALQSILKKLKDYGFDVNLDSIWTNVEDALDYLESANDKLKEMGKTDTDFNFDSKNIKDINSQLQEAKNIVDSFKGKDGKVDFSVDGAKEAEDVYRGLVERRKELENPFLMTADIEGIKDVNLELGNALETAKSFQDIATIYDVKMEVGTDTSQAESDIQAEVENLQSLSPEIQATLGIDAPEVQEAMSNIQANIEAGVKINPEDVNVIQEALTDANPEIEATIKEKLDSSGVELNQDGTINFTGNVDNIGEITEQEGTINYTGVFDGVDDYISSAGNIVTETFAEFVGGGSNQEVSVSATVTGLDGELEKEGTIVYTASVNGLDGELEKNGNITYSTTITGLDGELNKNGNIIYSASVTGIDGELNKNGSVAYSAHLNPWSPPSKSGTATYTATMNDWEPPTKFGTVVYRISFGGDGDSNGTANSFGIGLSNGTAYSQGIAFAHGTWGTKNSGVALGGEVGQELVVRQGRFFTIGDEGAEFFKYKKDDIMKMVSVHSDMCEK